MNAPDIARSLASTFVEQPISPDGRYTYEVLGPVNADSTSFVLIGTYWGDSRPAGVYRVSVERVQ